ncbi:MAG: thioredoxin domain-containing protein [Pseudomonadota bacterium]|nr:thioredoxin domain-containing protein [Pseudomonadota bacterium]
MSRKLLLLALLFAPLPAFASDGGSASLVIGGAAAAVLVCAVLVGIPRTRVYGVAAGSLLGILLAGYLTAQHHGTAASVCNVSDVWSCDSVNRSEYSEVAGVPVALFGVAFYAVMAWLSLRHASGGAAKSPAMMTAVAGFALIFDVYLAWASTRIGAYCPLCVASWGLNVVLLVGAALLWKSAETPSGASLFDGLKSEIGSVAVVGLLTLVVAGMASRPGDGATGATGGAGTGAVADLSQYYEKVAGRIELDGTEPVIGSPDAPYTMVEWADFECPHCGVMSEELKKVLSENPDVKLLYKHYPISGTCNSFVDGERHKFACNAAAASECARLQGRFWELSRQMFKNQEFLGKEDIRFMAEQHALDMTAFEACMADPATAEAVKQDVAAGGVAGVQGTPSIFLKGPFGDEWVRLTATREGINAVLDAARSGKPLPPARPPSEM